MRKVWMRKWRTMADEEIHWLYERGVISFLEAAFGPSQEIG